MTPSLARFHIGGFRSLRSVDLTFDRITVLIGANGAGKSNLLSALRMIPLIRTRSLGRFVGESGGASALLHYGPRVTPEIHLRLEFEQDNGANAYSAELGYSAGDRLIFLDETVEYKKTGATEFQGVSLGAGHSESALDLAAQDHTTAKTVRWWLSRLTFFHFHDTSMTSALRQNSRLEDTHYLRSDGSNLAAYLRALKMAEGDEEQKAWTRIGHLVNRIAPFIKHLEPTLVDPSQNGASAVRLDWVDERDEVFGPHHLSDGTLRAIALITALAQPTGRLPGFISIDEPELGLHPSGLGLLASLVKSVAPRCQVLLATQSPALLDAFDAASVVVTEREDGASMFRRLDAQNLASWLDDYSLSELYEKNVLGGRP